jgi:hypothetical protein
MITGQPGISNRSSRVLNSNEPSVTIEYIQMHLDPHVRGTETTVSKVSLFDDREAYLEQCVYWNLPALATTA